MIHGPCGQGTNRGCIREDGKCKQKFPKAFSNVTIVDDDMGYPIYRRRTPQDGGRTVILHGNLIDNRWVVPYNAYCSLCYECHINVEICVSAMVTKYLYKYVTKGPDKAMVATTVDGVRDKISEYEDLRSVGSGEAAWKLFAFPIA